MAEEIMIGVIGGSGLYNMPDLTDIEEKHIETPFGDPSDAIITGKLKGVPVAFVPRHGRGHVHSPSEVPYRANIYALKSLGARYVVAVSACGSLREDYAPGHIVIPDQLYDNTKDKRRGRTFFENGLVAHISVASPFCETLSGMLAESVRVAEGTVHEGGAYITIEGPRFSTKAESDVFRQWGMSIIGMTTSPEAYLAREAEIAYAVMAHVTDYDVWHETEETVTVEMVVRTMRRNLTTAQKALSHLIPRLAEEQPDSEAFNALEAAIITDKDEIPADLRDRLSLLVGKYL
ncbi:MAG: S-methyl-5'-thioadenosine phosphorylase [Chloroflexi bacterium]|nr:S-methyl-5'-thioadenosine phosphorylase [Chloroflexota bacterium]